MIKKTCEVCSKEFFVNNQREETARFCSWKCRREKNKSIKYLLQFIEIDKKTNCWNWVSTKDIKAVTNMGIILQSEKVPNSTGGYKWVFHINKDYE